MVASWFQVTTWQLKQTKSIKIKKENIEEGESVVNQQCTEDFQLAANNGLFSEYLEMGTFVYICVFENLTDFACMTKRQSFHCQLYIPCWYSKLLVKEHY